MYSSVGGSYQYIRHTGVGECQGQRDEAKQRPRKSRRPSAAKSIIRVAVPKDIGPVLMQLGLVPVAVDAARTVAGGVMGVVDNAINHRA